MSETTGNLKNTRHYIAKARLAERRARAAADQELRQSWARVAQSYRLIARSMLLLERS